MRRAVAMLLVGCWLLGCAGAGRYVPGRSGNRMATSVAAQQTLLARQTSVSEQQTAQPSSGATDELAITGPAQPTPGTQVPPSGTASPAATGVATPPAGTPSPAGTLGSLVPPDNLESYRFVEEIGFEGTAPDGVEVSELVTTTIELVREPLAMHATVTSDIEGLELFLGFMGLEGNTIETYVIEDSLYMAFFGSWMETSVEAMGTAFDLGGLSLQSDGSGLPFGPTEVGFSGTYTVTRWLKEAVYVGQETYSGVVTRHYTLDETSFDPEALPTGMAIEAASGDLHLAEDGNYVVRLDLTAEGINLSGPTPGEGPRLQEGTLNYRATLSAINEPLTIELPEEARQATSLPEDIAVPDDAQKLMGGGLFGMTLFGYVSDRSPAEVASFYSEAMPELEWTKVKADGSPPQYRFEYAKGDRTIVVEIDAEPEMDKTLIAISTGGPEQLFPFMQDL
jgi:hypothetical protein